ncbi:hypothetical protein BOTCAL_0069g00050 [Botryotinia calthae]|uniref:Uncharacterized protein n=1 Tax=Botryotinia calthae TaxID=38488 RepID=A0A4Y8D910_9HELO|nr:hypothetical protein BOTCAL_0069g00050 [Botryotinia calthae]
MKKEGKKTSQHNLRNTRKYRHRQILKTVIEPAESPDGGDEKNAGDAENQGEGVQDTDEEVLEDFEGAEIEGHGAGAGGGGGWILLVRLLASRGMHARSHVRDCEEGCVE